MSPVATRRVVAGVLIALVLVVSSFATYVTSPTGQRWVASMTTAAGAAGGSTLDPTPPPDAASSWDTAPTGDASPPSWWGTFATVFASLMLGFIFSMLLNFFLRIFPISVLPIAVRRAIGLLAGPALIGITVVFALRDPEIANNLLAPDRRLFFAVQLLLAATITGMLGLRLVPQGASRQWFGGMTFGEVLGDVLYALVGLIFNALLDGLTSRGGSRGGGASFSGGGGSSAGGGASGSW